VLALVLLRDSPQGRPPRVPLRTAFATASRGVREAWAEPGTRLGFWAGFMTLFPSMMFGVMWGYPFLTVGQGLPPATAGGLMLALSLSGLVYGVALGNLLARHPYYRSLIGIGLVGLLMVIWAAVLLTPGRAPLWLLVVLIVVLGTNGPGSMIGFDYARTENPIERSGSASGVVNVGGFIASLCTVLAIGFVLDAMTPGSSTDYSLGAFRAAFAVQ
jgi:hypothetical protein